MNSKPIIWNQMFVFFFVKDQFEKKNGFLRKKYDSF